MRGLNPPPCGSGWGVQKKSPTWPSLGFGLPSPQGGGRSGTDSVAAPSMSHPRRGRMPRHLEALAGVGDLGAVDLQDREILVDVISGQKIFAVRCERDGLGQSADLDVLRLRHLLAVDLQEREAAVLLVEERFLVGIRAAQDRGNCKIRLG